MGTWKIGVSQFTGIAPEETEVQADTVLDAVDQGMEALGFDDNDEGTYTITASLVE